MQGRLTPPTGEGVIQSFPVSRWRDEFPLAHEAGLCCIEWIFEHGTGRENPLGTDAGITEIRELSLKWGVAVGSICADYYMADPLLRPDGKPRQDVVGHLTWLVGRAALAGVRYIVLPFVDASSLISEAQVQGLRTLLQDFIPTAEDHGVDFTSRPTSRPGSCSDSSRISITPSSARTTTSATVPRWGETRKRSSGISGITSAASMSRTGYTEEEASPSAPVLPISGPASGSSPGPVSRGRTSSRLPGTRRSASCPLRSGTGSSSKAFCSVPGAERDSPAFPCQPAPWIIS